MNKPSAPIPDLGPIPSSSIRMTTCYLSTPTFELGSFISFMIVHLIVPATAPQNQLLSAPDQIQHPLIWNTAMQPVIRKLMMKLGYYTYNNDYLHSQWPHSINSR